jgi:hypothetical protein
LEHLLPLLQPSQRNAEHPRRQVRSRERNARKGEAAVEDADMSADRIALTIPSSNLLRNTRKTECGAKFLSLLAVRAAPFALLTPQWIQPAFRCQTQRSVVRLEPHRYVLGAPGQRCVFRRRQDDCNSSVPRSTKPGLRRPQTTGRCFKPGHLPKSKPDKFHSFRLRDRSASKNRSNCRDTEANGTWLLFALFAPFISGPAPRSTASAY